MEKTLLNLNLRLIFFLTNASSLSDAFNKKKNSSTDLIKKIGW